MTDLKEHRKAIEYCTYCPKMCRFSCPVAQAERRETVHPTAKMTLLHLIDEGTLEWTKETADTIFRCTGCLVSRTFCEHDIEVIHPYVAAREEAIKHGAAPDKVMEQDKVVAKHKNPYGDGMKAKLDGNVPSRLVRKDAKVMFFVGCTTIQFYDKHITSAIKLLEATGADLGVYVDDYVCCGYPSQVLGHRERFLEIARNVAERLNSAETVVTVCPTCASTLKDVYAKAGVELKANVQHISQYLMPFVKSGKLKFKKSYGKVLYHDPCHLGRYLGVYDEPRELFKLIARELIEFPWHHDESQCCGGGGGLMLTAKDTAKEIAKMRASFAKECSPDLMVSACPTCDRSLERAWDRKKVSDLVRMLADSLIEEGK